ncbi:uncharacterized protein ARMOST_21988 [Armillaria ostoyae]|uniref:Uncharacterized protein n=1 Tax=Armillaria ostoyae TaxID=47428 RepID=A0A284SBK9_ARMOS|nr:uncharacterized protein ARMOST_21988 [Armillaria ostoyae]
MVQSTVKEQGERSTLRFCNVCAELEVYLTDLHVQLNGTRRKSHGIKRFLKAKNVSDTIDSYRERVCAIKEDFIICTAIDLRLVISDIKDGLKTNTDALTTAIKTSQRHTLSNIDAHANSIYEEIRTWGISQSRRADKICADVQTLKERGSYKGFIRDVLPGDIYLKEHIIPSGPPKASSSFRRFDEYNAEVENSNAPKIVRIYHHHSSEKDMMKACHILQQFHIDVDRLINLKYACDIL